MYQESIERVASAARKKVDFLEKAPAKYFILSIFAGIFVGFGVILDFSVAAPLAAVNSPYLKLVMGASFGVALSLVIFAGSELFTGNNLVMTIGRLEKKISTKEMLKLWLWCYLGNLAGSLLIAWLFFKTGLISSSPVAKLILEISAAKMTAPLEQLFFRGILCNMLVTLAVWISIKAKNEVAKLILIFWCLYAFVASGFEHSIANMSLLSMALLIPHPAAINFTGFIRNLIPVTLGNIVGGALLIGGLYWYAGSNRLFISSINNYKNKIEGDR